MPTATMITAKTSRIGAGHRRRRRKQQHRRGLERRRRTGTGARSTGVVEDVNNEGRGDGTLLPPPSPPPSSTSPPLLSSSPTSPASFGATPPSTTTTPTTSSFASPAKALPVAAVVTPGVAVDDVAASSPAKRRRRERMATGIGTRLVGLSEETREGELTDDRQTVAKEQEERLPAVEFNNVEKGTPRPLDVILLATSTEPSPSLSPSSPERAKLEEVEVPCLVLSATVPLEGDDDGGDDDSKEEHDVRGTAPRWGPWLTVAPCGVSVDVGDSDERKKKGDGGMRERRVAGVVDCSSVRWRFAPGGKQPRKRVATHDLYNSSSLSPSKLSLLVSSLTGADPGDEPTSKMEALLDGAKKRRRFPEAERVGAESVSTGHQPLKGVRFVATGVTNACPTPDLFKSLVRGMVEEAGGKFTWRLSGKTNYLVVGDWHLDPFTGTKGPIEIGRKYQEETTIRKDRCRVLSIDELRSMIYRYAAALEDVEVGGTRCWIERDSDNV